MRVLGARLALRRGALDEALALADEILAAPARRRPTRCRPTLIAAEALLAAGPPRRRPSSAWRTAADALDPRAAPGAWGEFLRLRGALHAQAAQRRRGVPRLRAERERSRPPRRALSGGAQPPRARPPGRRDRRALGRRAPSRPGAARCSSSSAPSAISTTRAAAQRLLTDDRHRRVRRSRPPTPTMRSCGGWSTRRCCRTCSAARPATALLEAVGADCAVVFVELAGGDVRVVAFAGCDAGRRARARALGACTAAPTAAARSSSSRSAAIPTARASALVASPRPLGHPVDAAAADDRRRRAPGIRSVRRARAAGAGRRRWPSSARSSRCCPASSAPAPR